MGVGQVVAVGTGARLMRTFGIDAGTEVDPIGQGVGTTEVGAVVRPAAGQVAEVGGAVDGEQVVFDLAAGHRGGRGGGG